MSLKSVCAALVLLASATWGVTACDLLWQVGSPMPTGGLISHVVFENSTFVGVGGGGDIARPNFTVVSDTQIVAVTPSRPQGLMCVKVVTPGGRSVNTNATLVAVGTRPEISSVGKLSGPYRLKIQGSGFRSDDVILVNGVPVPKTAYKSGGLLLAQGGALLKVMLPKGQPNQIVILNSNLGVPSHVYTFIP